MYHSYLLSIGYRTAVIYNLRFWSNGTHNDQVAILSEVSEHFLFLWRWRPLMIQPQVSHYPNIDTRLKWFNSPVFSYEGRLTEIGKHIPEFERRSFALEQPGMELTRLNKRLDIIVRKPTYTDPYFVPVGVVSKEYVLVPHTTVLKILLEAFEAEKISPEDVKAELEITEYGERMALSLYLPDKYSFDPGDGHPMALRLECFNSVDGSTLFRTLMGWFRFVCRNGLIIGVTRTDLRRRHIGYIGLSDVRVILISGIKESEKEKKNFEKWLKCEVLDNHLTSWINGKLREKWGFKAAARTWHIAKTGHDADVIGPYKDNTPISIPMLQTTRIPGAPLRAQSLYDVSQILAWLAKERRDIQMQLEWRQQIPELIKPLLRQCKNV